MTQIIEVILAGPQGPTGPAGPAGPAGPTGQYFTPDAVGLTAGRSAYDAEAAGFSYLDTQTSQLYFKLSATSGDWSGPLTFGVGPQGETGPAGPAGTTTLADLGITVTAGDINDVTNKAAITGADNLTIANTAPSLFLNETDGVHYRIYASSSLLRFYNQDTSQTMAYMDGDRNLYVYGNVTAFSDQRLKDNIKVIPHALTKLHSIAGVTFKHKNSARRSTGVLAQDVQSVLPEAVHEGEDGYLSVAYGNLTGLLVEAIKELTKEVDHLKGQVWHLKERLDASSR